MEKWADVLNYEGIYSVSDKGNIKRIKLGKGVKQNRILRPYVMPNGYLQVALSNGCVEKKFYVHRLVLSAFTNGDHSKTVNHINGKKHDNRLSNLEYMTRSENTSHSHHVLGNSLRGERNGNAKLTANEVIKIRELAKHQTHESIAKIFKISRPTVTEISIGRKWKHL